MERRQDHRFDPFSAEAGQYDDFDMDNIDYNDPLAFFRAVGAGQPGGLPMPTLIAPADVRTQAQERSTSIFGNFALLQTILERHEGLIQKRWRKKTQSQRLKVLQASWGGPMSKTHRPDFDAFRKETEAQRAAGTRYREAFMWPYVNEEDLIKPRNLLLLLNARGHHSPAIFAAADYEAIHLGLVTKAIVPVFLNQHVMLFRGRTDPSTYGHLMNWDEHPDAFTWMHTRREHMPGEGLLILEIQQRLMVFLVDCAKQILLDLSEDELLRGPIQPVPDPISEHEAEFASLSATAAEAPYRVPSQLDFANIETSLLAKRDEAIDHLWNLREDPAYYSETMRDGAEHRQEMVKDHMGKLHVSVRMNNGSIFWGRVLANEFIKAYLSLEMWSNLAEQASKLKQMQLRYTNTIKPEDDLPQDYLKALLTFQYRLKQCAKGPLNMLKIGTLASPPWRPYHELKPTSDGTATTTKVLISRKPTAKFDRDQDQLLWLLRTLWEDDKPLFFVGLVNAVDELQRLLEASPKAKSMVTSNLADVIADLSIIAQCLRQVEGYQPWAMGFENALVEHESAIKEDFDRQMKPSNRMHAVCKAAMKPLVRHGAPNQINFYYPADKRATRENINAMRSAEAELDKLWMLFDSAIEELVDDYKSTAVHTLLTGHRTLHRTPEWIEPIQPAGSKTTSEVEKPNGSLSEMYRDLQLRTESTLQDTSNVPSSRVKNKDRTMPANTHNTTISDPSRSSNITESETAPTLDVDQRALKVFKTLFFTPSLTATPGETSWTDFLHAMVSTGFQPKKLHGSMWQFASTTPATRRSIIFHEPHPVGKIPYLVARRHGRRLNRVYGWTGNTFVLARK